MWYTDDFLVGSIFWLAQIKKKSVLFQKQIVNSSDKIPIFHRIKNTKTLWKTLSIWASNITEYSDVWKCIFAVYKKNKTTHSLSAANLSIQIVLNIFRLIITIGRCPVVKTYIVIEIRSRRFETVYICKKGEIIWTWTIMQWKDDISTHNEVLTSELYKVSVYTILYMCLYWKIEKFISFSFFRYFFPEK